MPLIDRLPDDLKEPDWLAIRILDQLSELYGPPEEKEGLSAYPAVDLPGFYEIVSEIIEDYQDRTDVTEQSQVIFSEEDPKFLSEQQTHTMYTEHITYKLCERLPGKVSAGRHGAGRGSTDGRREWKPRLRRIERDPDDILKVELVMGQFYDNVVEFSCWAQSNKAANARALWFEDLMSSYRWYFKLRGVAEVYFIERLEDNAYDGELGANVLKCRKLRFFVKTDRTFSYKQTVLRSMIVKVGVLT